MFHTHFVAMLFGVVYLIFSHGNVHNNVTIGYAI